MKKYLSIFFFIILAIAFSNKNVQASNFNDVLSSLSDALYNLKNILSADIYNDKNSWQPGPGYMCNTTSHLCVPSPNMGFSGQTLDECAAVCFSDSLRPTITSDMIKCQTNSDCALVNTKCCSVYPINTPSNNERSFWSDPINKGYLIHFVDSLKAYCGIYNPVCPDIAGKFYDFEYYTTCENNICVAHKEAWKKSTLYICNSSTYQCVEAANGIYNSIDTCQNDCKAPGSAPAITNAQRSCTSDYNCQIVETDCCGCAYGTGYDFKTKQAINKTSYSQYYQQLKTYCTANKLGSCTLVGTNTCYLTPTAKCVSSLCTAVWPAPKVATLTSTMRKCTKDTDCVLAESACCGCDKGGNDSSKIGLNKNYLITYTNQILSYCDKTQAKCTSTTNNCGTTSVVCENKLCVAKITQASNPNPPTSTTQWYTHGSMVSPSDHWYSYIKGSSTETWKTSIISYLTSQSIVYKNIIVQEMTAENTCMALGCEVPPFFIEVSSEYFNKMTSLGFITSANPGSAPTYQNLWYKADVTLGNPKELWYQGVLSCASSGSTKEQWEQCAKDYLKAQNVNIKSIIIGTVPVGSCTPIGCQAPSIWVQVSSEYKTKMAYLGFSESEDPTKPVDPSIVKVDLSKQSLFYAIEKTTSNINYEVVDKNISPICGDGKCETIEKYLYEIDLTKECTISEEPVINYKHCYNDCGGKLDTGKSITKTDFYLLKPQCSNKTITPEPQKTDLTIPLADKPINQMTVEEKNQYTMQLQMTLIQLLTQLLNLLRAQRGL